MMQFFSVGLVVGFVVTTAAYLVLDRIESCGVQKDIQKALLDITREQGMAKRRYEKTHGKDY